MDAGRKSTVGRAEYLLELVVCCCSQLAQGLIFRHCCCVAEDNIAAAGKGRSLLISAGTMKTLLLSFHRIDHALLLLLRGGATRDEDDGDGDVMLLDEQTLLQFLLIFTCSSCPVFLVSGVGFITLVSCFVSLGSWPSIGPGFFLFMSMCRKELDRFVSSLVRKTI
ncbi:hypothetical protein NC653_034884 [Populus alba x Populus x berolinensis]|uniref:Uncharacterized protein n=1 Tax=Populus alba x Populus x berolinensis TaxID=444605 RepID=A0AAD6LNJ2_9ROSI|nr:hypothetical protein NC653_034884 [Populus alba x Populus x berolinensis]